MREAHAHLAGYGEALTIPSLSGCASLAECLDRVRQAAADSEANQWVRLTSARVESWPERRWPTMRELNAACRARCVIMSFDHHSAMANTSALVAAGLRAGVSVSENGLVCIDPGGEPTGVLLEDAAYKAWQSAPEPDERERERQVGVALASLRSLGYTEAHDLNSQPWLGPILSRLERRGELDLRVWLYPPVADIERSVRGRHAWESESVRVAGAKIFADGTLNSRTAFMLEPYLEPLPGMERGKAMLSPWELAAHVAATARLGYPVAVHAIGDAAARMVLDALEHELAHGGGERARQEFPYRVEHCELIDEADVGRFARLGVVCGVQPCHLLADVEALRRFVPAPRLERVLPMRELIATGCRPGELMWFGSDVPIVGADPADSVQAATQRRRPGMLQAAAIGWSQRIGEAEAWAAFGLADGASPGHRLR
ncbi:MAG: amidohydrolase family protein [Phycisphaerales bacterium]|nr:amidohydrolase family protein [Phycisphaerales bacterium]